MAINTYSIPQQKTITQLLALATFPNDLAARDFSSEKVLNMYLENGDYVSLKMFSDNSQMKSDQRNSANEWVNEAMLMTYDYLSTSNDESKGTVSHLGFKDNALFQTNKEFYSFENIVKDSVLTVSDKVTFSEKIFQKWLGEGNSENLSHVANSYGINKDIAFDKEVISLANSYLSQK